MKLTHWIVTSVDREPMHFVTPELAEAYVAMRGRRFELGFDPDEPKCQVEKVEREYRPGDRVTVRAFGRLRDGVVESGGRTKVKVRFQRNRQGTVAVRSFGALEISAARR